MMKVKLLLVCLIVGGGFSAGCATASPSTTFIAPQCASATSRDGRVVENGNAVRFDNGFDLPFTERTVTYEMPNGESKTVIVESNAQDPVRLYGGACLGILGCLNVGNGLLAQSRSAPAASASYVIGAALIGIGGGVALFGWRAKDQDLVAYAHGECEDAPDPPVNETEDSPGADDAFAPGNEQTSSAGSETQLAPTAAMAH